MSFASETRERSRPVLPLAAMVDILFLLLIFFMTASTMRDQELRMQVDLPESQTAQAAGAQPPGVVVTFDAKSRIYVGQREVSLPQLQDLLSELKQASPHESVVVRGDVAGGWGLGIKIMDVAKAAGITDVSAATVEPLQE